MSTPFPVGKLPHSVLERLLGRYITRGERVVVGPRIGEDAAVLEFGDRLLVAKTDPITFASDRIGWYAVNVCANDIATMGARPLWFLASILLPEGKSDEALVESLFRDLALSCAELDVSLCGGHTEITYGLTRPIVVGQMLGEVARDRLVTSSGAEPGDALLLTKGIAVEGTAILVREKAEFLQARLPQAYLENAAGFLFRPGISVVREAQALGQACRPKAMHDATEGGLATALRELAAASGVGLEVDEARVHVFPESRGVCECLGLNPWGLIASGALLAAVRPEEVRAAIQAVESAGVACHHIGEVRSKEFGLRIRSGVSLRNLPVFEVDELARVFS